MKTVANRQLAWRLTASEDESLAVGWSAWLASIARGFFDDETQLPIYRSAAICGVTEAAAQIISTSVAGRPVRRSAPRAGSDGCVTGVPPRSLHDVLAEMLAHAAVGVGRSFCRKLKHVAPVVAANAVAHALLHVLEAFLVQNLGGEQTAANVQMEFAEALRRRMPMG